MSELFTEEDVQRCVDAIRAGFVEGEDGDADFVRLVLGAMAKAGRLVPPVSGHPEDRCHRCGRPNVVWSAPSPLWNQVMRGGSINGEDAFDGIVCPACFALLAQDAGAATTWTLSADRVLVELETVTPSGRTWNATVGRWLDVGEDSDKRTIEELERIHGYKLDAILPDGSHRYWSTHCRHGHHEACSAKRLESYGGTTVRVRPGREQRVHLTTPVTITRQPAQCKTCWAPCVCTCHQEGAGS